MRHRHHRRVSQLRTTKPLLQVISRCSQSPSGLPVFPQVLRRQSLTATPQGGTSASALRRRAGFYDYLLRPRSHSPSSKSPPAAQRIGATLPMLRGPPIGGGIIRLPVYAISLLARRATCNPSGDLQISSFALNRASQRLIGDLIHRSFIRRSFSRAARPIYIISDSFSYG